MTDHLRPLSQRVDAPAVLALPADTADLTWRAATLADVDAIYELEREVAPVDHPHFVVPREEIAHDFEESFFDASSDSALAFDADGHLVGFGFAIMPDSQDTLVRSIVPGAVRPSARGRGVGRQLFAWQHDRALQQLATSDKTLPGWIIVFTPDDLPRANRLYERAGLSLVRYFLELRRDLSEPIAEVALDPDVRIETMTPQWHEHARVARNDAFRDHWGSQPTPRDSWESFVGRAVTRGDLSSLAIAERDGVEEVAGFVITSVNEEDWTQFSSAYIDLVGVPRGWRKRGLAPALIANTLRLVAAQGIDKAVLDVDAENPSGALGLYAGLGFTEATRSLGFTKVF